MAASSEFSIARTDPSLVAGTPTFAEDPEYNGAGYLYYNTTDRELRVNTGLKWKNLKEKTTFNTLGLVANVDWNLNQNGSETINGYGTSGLNGGGSLQTTTNGTAQFSYQEFPTNQAFVIDGNQVATDFLSVDILYKASGQPGDYAIIYNKENCWELSRRNNTATTSDLWWALWADNQSWFWDDANCTINVGEWYHLVLTYDGNQVKFYKNGQQTDSYTYPSGGKLANQTSCWPKLASRNCDQTTANSYPCPGGYAYFRIYSIAMTPTMIQQNYQYAKSKYGI